MAFNYNELEEKQYLADMTREVNKIGNYLKNDVNKEYVETIGNPDFNNILEYINVTGDYYVTTSKNQPKGENWNGYVFFEKRNNNYYKVYFNPFNNENLYLRTFNNGTLTDWQRFIRDEETNTWQKYKFTNSQGQYATQEDVDIRELNNSKTVYVKNLVDPPKPELDEGWLDIKVHESGNTSISTFNPINSTTTYTKMQKQSREVQNPNLLRDSLFEEAVFTLKPWSTRVEKWTWDIIASSEVTITEQKKFEGHKTAKVTNKGTGRYPIIRSKGIEIGKDVQPGEELTFSTYLYVPDLESMKDNLFYIQITKYTDDLQDINTSVQTVNYSKEDLKEKTWQILEVTATVPSLSEAKYIACAMRINNTNSVTDTDMVGYYALPKLEKGDKATPFITHVDDKVQFDEIYTNWLENPDEQSVLNNYVSDINNDNYFKYTFWKDEVGDMTLQDLIKTLPQGFHTFYAQGGIEGTPKGNSVRGTVQVDNDNGDIKLERKFINAQFTDYDGLNYNLYYDDNRFSEADSQDGWSPLRKTEQATYLWDGNFDLGEENSVITLEDDYENYEYLEILYNTAAAGHDKIVRIRTNGTNFYIRDINLTNNSTSASVEFFEGYFTAIEPKKVQAKMMKTVGMTNQEVMSFNAPNKGTIKRITGINTI